MATKGRDSAGRFTTGNGGGPGRPKRQTEREYLRVVLDACPLEEWAQIVACAVEDAKGGDAKARQWLASHLLGHSGSNGPTPSDLAVEDESGLDPLRDRISIDRMVELMPPPGSSFL